MEVLPPCIPAVGDEKGRGEETQGEHVPPQQVQEPGIVCLVHSGKTVLSDSLSPHPKTQASQTALGFIRMLLGHLLPRIQLSHPHLRPSSKALPGPCLGQFRATLARTEAHLKYRKRKE